MACRFPLTQYRVGDEWTFVEPTSPSLFEQRQLRCGQCALCRMAKASEWEVRLIHEGLLRPNSIALTATYSPEHLPPYGSLRADDFSAFIKRLRARVAARGGPRLSFDMIGEYSPELMRPHFHAALFDYVPPDGKPWAKSGAGNDEFISAELTAAWGKGLLTFQPWSAGGARYISAHQAWKLSGHASEARRQVLDPVTGEVVAMREPESHRCSSRPGIGRGFMERYGEQALQNGWTVARRGPVPLPRYYLRVGAILEPELAEQALEARRLKALEQERHSAERLDVMDEVAAVRLSHRRKGQIS